VERQRRDGDVQLMTRVGLLALVVAAVAGCGALPDIAVGVCGNHIVEAGEDCDSAEPGCVPAGEPDACHRRCGVFPDGVCPPGSICDAHGACVEASGCGNHVVEPGEACDGEVGCIAPGQPGECQMSCSAYAGGVCPPMQICDGRGACVAAAGQCGNGFVDPGEECDGTAGCIAAGAPDACKLACAAHPEGHCPAGTICDAHGACVAAAATCGNLVVEPGEDCDGSVGCGAPGTAAACRFSCAGGVACAHGWVCGQDSVCRQPTGRFRLSAPFGRGDEAFELADLDGDGVRDVMARGPHTTTLYHNDGHGALSVVARGATPPRPIDEPVLHPAKAPPRPAPALALTRDGAQQLLVAATPRGADLFRLSTPPGSTVATLQPLVTSTQRMLASSNGMSFVGLLSAVTTSWPYNPVWTAVFRQDGPGGVSLVLAAIDRLYGRQVSTTFDVAKVCGVSGSAVRVQAMSRGTAMEIAVVIDDRWLCLGEGTVGTLEYADTIPVTWHTFDVVDEIAQLVRNLWYQEFNGTDPHVGQATVLDINGDGRLDVGVWYWNTNGGDQIGGFVFWERNADSTWPALPAASVEGLRPPVSVADPLAAVDLDGDHRDDLLYTGEVRQSVHFVDQRFSGDYFPDRSAYAYPPVRASDRVALAIGDVSGDRRADLVQIFSTRPDVSVCRQAPGSAFPGLSCLDEPSGLATVSSVTLADVSGDGRADILAVGHATPAGGGGSTLSLIAGSEGSGDPPTPVLLPAYRSTIYGGAPGAPAGASTTAWMVVSGEDGSWSLAQSHPYNQGGLSFGWSGGSIAEVRAGDYDGDGNLDVALLGINVNTFRGPKLDTTRPAGGLGDEQNARFLDVPGEPHPLVFSASGYVQIGWYAPQQYSDYQWFQTSLTGSQWSAKVQDVDGDGNVEIVMFDPDCNVYVGRWQDHRIDLHRIDERPIGYACDDVFFADVAPQDGLPDAIFEVRGSGDTVSHLLLERARGDGTWDEQHALLDPPLASTGAATAALPAGSKWVGAADLDGDGVSDLVFWTPDGAVIAFGEVVRK
jgi:hypothetical protein